MKGWLLVFLLLVGCWNEVDREEYDRSVRSLKLGMTRAEVEMRVTDSGSLKRISRAESGAIERRVGYSCLLLIFTNDVLCRVCSDDGREDEIDPASFSDPNGKYNRWENYPCLVAGYCIGLPVVFVVSVCCSTLDDVDPEKLMLLEYGMTQTQVDDLLGPPDCISVENGVLVSESLTDSCWLYEATAPFIGNDYHLIRFEEGVLVEFNAYAANDFSGELKFRK